MTNLSPAETLLRTFHGRCGHRRQVFENEVMPCATPECREGGAEGELLINFLRTGPMRTVAFTRLCVPFGDEKHFVWMYTPSEEKR